LKNTFSLGQDLLSSWLCSSILHYPPCPTPRRNVKKSK